MKKIEEPRIMSRMRAEVVNVMHNKKRVLLLSIRLWSDIDGFSCKKEAVEVMFPGSNFLNDCFCCEYAMWKTGHKNSGMCAACPAWGYWTRDDVKHIKGGRRPCTQVGSAYLKWRDEGGPSAPVTDTFLRALAGELHVTLGGKR
jgi:hypothetical protein